MSTLVVIGRRLGGKDATAPVAWIAVLAPPFTKFWIHPWSSLKKKILTEEWIISSVTPLQPKSLFNHFQKRSLPLKFPTFYTVMFLWSSCCLSGGGGERIASLVDWGGCLFVFFCFKTSRYKERFLAGATHTPLSPDCSLTYSDCEPVALLHDNITEGWDQTQLRSVWKRSTTQRDQAFQTGEFKA